MITTLLICLSVLLMLRLMMLRIPHPRTLYYVFKLPGPWGLPLIGHTLAIMREPPQALESLLTKYAKKYKRFVGFTVSGIPLIGLFKPEDIKHLLADNRNINKGIGYECVELFLGDGLVTSKGEQWRKSRKLMNAVQFNVKKLEATVPLMAKQSRQLVENLMNTLSTPVDIMEYFLETALNIIFDSITGSEFEVREDRGKLLDMIKRAEESISKRISQVWKINPKIYGLTKEYREDLKILEDLKNIFQQHISTFKKNHQWKVANGKFPPKKTTDGNQYDGSGTALLEQQAMQPDFVTDKYLWEEAITLIAAAHETTGICTSMMIYMLAIHPDIQEKCYEELVDVVGEEEISAKNVKDLVYLEMVMKETLRLYSTVPFFSRSLDTDIILDDGVVLPRGANVTIIPTLVHKNEEYFPDPERFDPDRFLPDQVAARHPFAFIPFSAGPRSCIGQRYAQLEVKVMAALILKTFRVETTTKLEELELTCSVTLKPNSPIMCNFIPRKHA